VEFAFMLAVWGFGCLIGGLGGLIVVRSREKREKRNKLGLSTAKLRPNWVKLSSVKPNQT
jgi:hypothetical protein